MSNHARKIFLILDDLMSRRLFLKRLSQAGSGVFAGSVLIPELAAHDGAYDRGQENLHSGSNAGRVDEDLWIGGY